MVDVTEFDCLIVGNGALGLFLANELAERARLRVAISGDARRPTGASQAAGAMLGCFAEVTAETFVGDAGRERFELSLAARHRWPDLLKRLRSSDDTARSPDVAEGTYVVLNTCGSELDSENFDAITAAAEHYAEPWTEVDPAAIRGYCPRPDARALRAIHIPGEGGVDARAVLDLVERRVRAAGVTMLPEVAGLASEGGQVTGAVLADGKRVAAGATVVAAGARSGALLAPVLEPDEVMPMFAGLGFAVVAERTRGAGFESVVRTPNRAFACGLHLVPLGGKREYLGATNMVVGEPQANGVLGDVHFLTGCAMAQLDEEIYHHQITGYRVGNRPVSLDGLPLVGWVREPGLYLLTGTYRDGFHNAPLLAEHAADQLAGGAGVIGETFSPRRTPIFTRSVERSIEDFVRHRMAAWYETGAESPPNMPSSALRQILREQARTFYERLGLERGLPPDLLMHVLGTLQSRRTAAVLRYLRS
ncbi:NAD(P)/FAD-dependent oxidoreductase [Actinomadura chokoriensis]|uniref:FAD-dependent oxidoreductase n=1 Tax=Actinomadura chokoriensis TaxID=454156 RepID=A0ABV4QXA1_9ACTN